SADTRLVLRIAQQRKLRASVALQLRVSKYCATPSSLPQAPRDSTFHTAEAGAQHCIGYLSRRRVADQIRRPGFRKIIVNTPPVMSMVRVHADHHQRAAWAQQSLRLCDELFEVLEVVNRIYAEDQVDRRVAQGQGPRRSAYQTGAGTFCGRMAQHFPRAVDAAEVLNRFAQR